VCSSDLVLGYVCTGGACVPCNTNDSCTAACTACMPPNQFCYTGYCGNCLTSGGCIAPAECVLGVCQSPLPFDGGIDAGPQPDAGRDAGPDAGRVDAGHGDGGGDGGDGGSMGDGGTGGGCGCASSPGAAVEVALLALIALAIFSPRRRREG
jgi:MYXO-CTERM domain-containing protein